MIFFRRKPTKFIFNCNECDKETMVTLFKIQKALQEPSFFVCYQDPNEHKFVNKIYLKDLKVQTNEYMNEEFDNVKNFYTTNTSFNEGSKFHFLESFVSESPKCLAVVYLKNTSKWTHRDIYKFIENKDREIKTELFEIKKFNLTKK